MPRFAANLSLLFTEHPLLERVAAAAAAGFRAVEIQFPYAVPAASLRERLDEHGLALVLHNLPAGDWAAGDRGIACDPARIAEFEDGVGLAIDYATTLGCRQLNCLAGLLPEGVSLGRAEATLLANLSFAAECVEAAGLGLLIEPLNTADVPGFLLTRSDQALSLIAAVGAENLRLQYDVYHMQIMEGDVAATIERSLDRIGHIQIADVPGRHEPGTGTIDFPTLFAHLDRIGYAGWVGCEYLPLRGTAPGLGWLAAAQAGAGVGPSVTATSAGRAK